jgi:hypothetical protein
MRDTSALRAASVTSRRPCCSYVSRYPGNPDLCEDWLRTAGQTPIIESGIGRARPVFTGWVQVE